MSIVMEEVMSLTNAIRQFLKNEPGLSKGLLIDNSVEILLGGPSSELSALVMVQKIEDWMTAMGHDVSDFRSDDRGTVLRYELEGDTLYVSVMHELLD